MGSGGPIGGGPGGVPAGGYIPGPGELPPPGVDGVEGTDGTPGPTPSPQPRRGGLPDDGVGFGVEGYGGPTSTSAGYTEGGWDEVGQAFTDAGLPNPYNGNTTPGHYNSLQGNPDYQAAGQAMRNWMISGSPSDFADFKDKLGKLPMDNIMETLAGLVKDSIKESNEIKKYFLKQIADCNKIAQFISTQQKEMAEASSTIAQGERGAHKEHPNESTATWDVQVPDVNGTVGPDGQPGVAQNVRRTGNRDELASDQRILDNASEDLKARRDEIKAKFTAVDQSVQGDLQKLTQIIRIMGEMRAEGGKKLGS